MPSWATTLVRTFLAWEALELALVALVAQVFYQVLAQGRRLLCELGAISMVASQLVTLGLAIVAVALAIWLNARRLRPGFLASAIGCALASGMLMVGELSASTTVEGSRYLPDTFQFWAVRPLMLWPSTGVILTLAVGMAVRYGAWPRALRVGWPVVCALLSLFFLSYLLPATDPRVAALHGLGVVHLPRGAGTLVKSDGTSTVRDRDLWYFIDDGYGGYLVTGTPGDYRVSDTCVTGTVVLGPEKFADIYSGLGAIIVAPDLCPH